MKLLERALFLRALLAAGVLTLGCSSNANDGQQEDAAEGKTVQLQQAVANAAEVGDGYVKIASDSADDESAKKLLAHIDTYQQSGGTQPVYFMANRSDDAASDDGSVDVNAANPFGVGRKAVGYRFDGGDLVVDTEPASLEQLIGEGDLDDQVVVDAEQAETPTSVSTRGLRTFPKIPIVDLTGRELYRGDLGVIKLGRTFVEASANIDYGLVVRRFRLRNAHLIISGDLTTQLVVEAQLAKNFPEKTFEKEVYTGHLALPPAGPVPLSLRVSLKAGCRASTGGSLKGKAGLKVVASATVGFDFVRGRDNPLQGVGKFGLPVHELIGPEFVPEGHAQIYCYLEPRFSVLFFESLGPHNTFHIGADLQFNAPPPTLKMDAKSKGAVGGEVRLFSFELSDFQLPVFDKSDALYDGDANLASSGN